MGAKAGRAKTPKAGPSGRIPHGIWALTGVAVATGWTGFGCGIAALQGELGPFVKEWIYLHGFFLVAFGAWLLRIIHSGALLATIANLGAKNAKGKHQHGTGIRLALLVPIGIVGTASLIALGFPTHGALLGYMWITCAWVCFTAGGATVHTLEIITAVASLQGSELKLFKYAPARTPELRALVSYFSSFTLIVTVGYIFALLATLAPHWQGSAQYIEAVRIFWPVIYVPICSVALVYPHLCIHRLIQAEKERTLLTCQQDIDGLLARFEDLKTEDIERTNTLAQLLDRIAATPNYVVDFGIAVRTALPLIINVISFFAKAALTHS